MIHYIEDLLHYYVDTIGVSDKDAPILTSISKQVKKGTALTDRQYDLVLEKLSSQSDVLKEHDLVVDNNPTRLPLREIDRSKYITVISHSEMLGPNSVYEAAKENWKWIKVRFPFAKKSIVKIENIINTVIKRKYYNHVKGSHEHYFRLDPNVAIALVDNFSEANFVIDQELVDYVNKAKKILDNKKDYYMHFKNGKMHNEISIVKQNVDYDDVYNVKDKHLFYGYDIELDNNNNNTLLDIVSNRKEASVLADPKHYSLNNIAEVFERLQRYPMIVLIDNNKSYEQVKQVYNAFNMLIPNENQSVLFRAESNDEENHYLNDFIKSNNLNNWVDKTTKIVYIKKNKLPKLLLTTDFKPQTAFSISSDRTNTVVNAYVEFNCDLILYNDEHFSSFKRYSF
jgi:hypothetical protein